LRVLVSLAEIQLSQLVLSVNRPSESWSKVSRKLVESLSAACKIKWIPKLASVQDLLLYIIPLYTLTLDSCKTIIMSLTKLASNIAAYNLWVNEQYVTWLSSKPEELLHREVPSSYSSIMKTLNHIWGTDEYWYGVIAETTDIENRYGLDQFVTQEIFDGLLRRSRILVDTVPTISEEAWMKNIKVLSPWFHSDLPRYEYLQHMTIHSAYHRGQIVTMGRNIGITDAPMTDYNFYNVKKAELIPV
jgi:uncharacterized damage-inducible protein DinB